MKWILIGAFVDSFFFALFFGWGIYHLFSGNTFEACALICTSVFWQRAWKAEALAALRTTIEVKGDGV